MKKNARYTKNIKTFYKIVSVLKSKGNSEEAVKTLYYYVQYNCFCENESIVELVKQFIILETFEDIVSETVENGYLMNDILVVKIIQVFSDYFDICVFYYKDSNLLTKIFPVQDGPCPIIFVLQNQLAYFNLLLPSEFTDGHSHNFSQYPFFHSNYEVHSNDSMNEVIEEEEKSSEEQIFSETIENSSKYEESILFSDNYYDTIKSHDHFKSDIYSDSNISKSLKQINFEENYETIKSSTFYKSENYLDSEIGKSLVEIDYEKEIEKKPSDVNTAELGQLIREVNLHEKMIKDEHLDLTIFKIGRLYKGSQ